MAENKRRCTTGKDTFVNRKGSELAGFVKRAHGWPAYLVVSFQDDVLYKNRDLDHRVP